MVYHYIYSQSDICGVILVATDELTQSEEEWTDVFPESRPYPVCKRSCGGCVPLVSLSYGIAVAYVLANVASKAKQAYSGAHLVPHYSGAHMVPHSGRDTAKSGRRVHKIYRQTLPH